MYKVKLIQAAAIVMLISSPVWATSDDSSQDSSDMPMMKGGNSGTMMSPEMMANMMSPETMQMMMNMMNQRMGDMGHGHNHGHGYGYGCGQNHGMPMMGGGMGNSMMGGGMGNSMMSPGMMQMRMQHMTNMEQRLENIESLLSQLVELQKSN